ncbi:class I SAM-dependent methyltransferase [Patescibacteria group bacterium]
MVKPTSKKFEQTWENVWRSFKRDQNIEKTIKKHKYERKYLYEILIKYLKKSPNKLPKFLEVGCGTAIDSYILANKINSDVYGIDLVQESIDLAHEISKNFNKKIKLVTCDGKKMPFKSESFDMVFSQGLLEHFKEPSDLIKEQLRILKVNGYLVISVPQTYNPYTLYKRPRIKMGTWPYGWETSYSLADLKKIEKKYSNLELIDRCGYGYDIKHDYGLGLLRYGINRIQGINPIRNFFLFRLIEDLYEGVWSIPEKSFGHHFMISIVGVYRKKNEKQ